jgi:peptidoglycan/LPS O-acetylase OafA/YrhL
MMELRQASNGQIPVIGALRGLAALSVALFHIINSPTGFETNEAVRRFVVHGAHGVQVFFVISGFVIPLSLMRKGYQWGDFGRFMWKRSIRLEPTYLVVIALGVLWIPIRSFLLGEEMRPFPTSSEVFLNVFYLIPFTGGEWINAVFWTLGIELQFYLLCAFIFGMKRSNLTDIGMYALPLLSVLLADQTTGMFVFHWLDFFIAGGFIAMYLEGRIASEKLGILLILCQFSATINHGYFLAAILTVTSLIILFMPNRRGGNALQFLGDQSYSLYLIHPLVGTTFVNGAMRFFEFNEPWVHWSIVIGATVASVCSAQLLYKWIEGPTMRWSKSVRLKS